VKKKKPAKTASRRSSTQRPAGRGAPRPALGRSARPSPAPQGAGGSASSTARTTTSQTTGGLLMANVKPLRDRVLVRRIEEAEQKVGGIIIPDTAKEKPLQAEVIAVGSGRLLENGQKVELTLKPGDKVLIGKWSGTEVKIDDEDLLILKEDEILGILS
jgi:chaperonin GroES